MTDRPATSAKDTEMHDLLHCRCGYRVWRGLDCVLCGLPGESILADARAITEVLELPELRSV